MKLPSHQYENRKPHYSNNYNPYPMFMAQKRGPKTLTGMIRKMETGDGRKKTNLEKIMDGDVNPYTGEKVKKK